MIKSLKYISSKSILIFIIILIIVICAFLTVSVFWQHKKEIKISPYPCPIGGVFLTGPRYEEDISEWETYKNEEYGFEIKHSHFASEYIAKPKMNSPHGEWGEQIGELVAFQNGANPFCQFNATVYSNSKSLSPKDFWETAFTDEYQIKTCEDITLGEHPVSGVKFYMEKPHEDFLNGSIAILIEKDSNIIVLLWWGLWEGDWITLEDKCFKTNLMLSTFKFLE